MRREQTNRKETIRWDKIRPKEKRNKREKGGKLRKKRRGKIGQWGSKQRERERGERKKKIFPVFRRSKLDDLRRKVDPHIASYAWVPKSLSFIKFHEVGNFPTLNIFSLKVM